MAVYGIPILLFLVVALALSAGMILLGQLVGPARSTAVKRMPYESGMDPIHTARRRFDVRFHLVAIAFLLFDVELLFLYPWAVAARDPQGLARLTDAGGAAALRHLVFGEILVFLVLLTLGYVYAWRRGVFQWR